MDIKVLASSSKGNAYRISDSSTAFLLDAGIPLKALQVGCNFKLREIAGCFITHAHKDHSKAAQALASAGVDVYTGQGTIDACGLTGHRIHCIESLKEIEVGSFKVLPFDVEHDAPEPLGFLFASKSTGEKLLYFTDTYYIKYRFRGLTHILAECNYDAESMRHSVETGLIPIEMVPRLVKSHMSLDNLIALLKANDLSKVRQIYLIHLSENNSNAEYCKHEVQKYTGAEVFVC